MATTTTTAWVMSRPVRLTTAVPTDVVARLDALDQKLDRILALLESRREVDGADRALLVTLRELSGDRTFTSRDVIDHARIHAALADALLACDLVTSHDVGTWLRKMRGLDVDGLMITREVRTAGGVRWSVSLRPT